MKAKSFETGTTLAEAGVLAFVFHLLAGRTAVSGAALGMAAALAGASVAVAVRSVCRRNFRVRRLACPLALLLAVCAHGPLFAAAWPPAPWAAGISVALAVWVAVGNVACKLGFPLLVALSAAAGALLL
ncbi:MAG: hypothetical protein J1F06_07180 [Prevotellaceae bacterium]|nr:hypothetical protein [Prevotellaceae bacterium]